MTNDPSRYRVKLAETDEELAGAQRLRYRVFVEEMGADATAEQQARRQEWDAFDPHFDHLVLLTLDPVADPLDRVVGAYRLMQGAVAASAMGYYGAAEYDLSPIITSGRSAVEVGRSCVAREHRGGAGVHLLWNGLAAYVLERNIELLFGVASFHGTDPVPIAEALAYLHHNYLAPADLRVRARGEDTLDMDLMPPEAIDATRAQAAIPPLIKAYLRLGGFVGEGAFVDRKFNTIDVCIVMDTGRMTDRYLQFYRRTQGRKG